jgi:hypothetical protein
MILIFKLAFKGGRYVFAMYEKSEAKIMNKKIIIFLYLTAFILFQKNS